MKQKSLQKFKGSINGFSLLEVLISVSVLVSVLMIFFTWMVGINKKHTTMMVGEDLNNDINYSFTTIGDLITNSAKIYPSEDMYAHNDQLYMGVMGVNRAPTEFDCLFRRSGRSETFSIMRLTTVMEERPEKTLYLWNANQANSSSIDDMIRISYRSNPEFVFQNLTNYHYNQVYLVDADGLAGKRFNISGNRILRENSNIHPYDNRPRPTGNYNYNLLQLNAPIKFDRTRHNPQDVQFVTGSLIYAARTYYICVSSNNQLVLIDEMSPRNPRVLMNPSRNKYTISKFEIKYLAQNNTSNLDLSAASLYPTNRTQAECVNMVTINLELTPEQNSSANAEQNKIVNINKYYILENFNTRKPAACNP